VSPDVPCDAPVSRWISAFLRRDDVASWLTTRPHALTVGDHPDPGIRFDRHDASMIGLGLYAQAKELLAAAELEPHFVADRTPLPACRTDEWAVWARRAGDAPFATDVDVDVAGDHATILDVTRVRAGRVKWVSTAPRD
jgi:hypothetical protein